MIATDGLLIAASFCSSAVAGTFGLGGGLLLVALMTTVMPAATVIPLHGVVQLASNASRALLDWRHADLPIVVPFVAGAALGAVLGAGVVATVPRGLFAVTLGVFMLVVVWMPQTWAPARLPGGFFAVGVVQTIASLFVGATGPFNAAFLTRAKLGKDRTIVTHAGMMTALHLAKVAAFAAAGFAFAPYAVVLGGMVVAATLGTWAGRSLRGRVSERGFEVAFDALVTLLALRLIVSAIA